MPENTLESTGRKKKKRELLTLPKDYNEFENLPDDVPVPSVTETEHYKVMWDYYGYNNIPIGKTRDSMLNRHINCIRVLNHQEVLTLSRRWHRLKDESAIQRLVEHNLKLVLQTVKKSNFNTHYTHEDAFMNGVLGLNRGLKKFDPEAGFKLSTYVVWWIKQSIVRETNEQQRTVKIPLHLIKDLNDVRNAVSDLCDDMQFPNRSYQEIADYINQSRPDNPISTKDVENLLPYITATATLGVESEDGDDSFSFLNLAEYSTNHEVEEMLQEESKLDFLRRGMEMLTEREKLIISLRYGLEKNSQPLKLGEIGDFVGLTKERVRQIANEALKKIRRFGELEGITSQELWE